MNSPNRTVRRALNDPTFRVTLWGAVVNIALSVLKVGIGLLVHSISLVADGLHSLSDLVTDAAVLIGVRAAERPADPGHPYGHGRFETLAAAFVSLVLIAVGFGIVLKAAQALYADAKNPYSVYVLLAAGVSICSKEWMYRATRRVAMQSGSSAVLANAWHHRSDALSSVAVVIGVLFGLAGFDHGDQVAGIIVGAMVIVSGGKILAASIMELSEASIEGKFYDQLHEILEKEEDVRSWHACKGRRVGREVYLDCHVLVDPAMTVRESHGLTERVENQLKSTLQVPVNLLIHIEPFHGERPRG
ncbi:cation transporter [bacterium]|nr:cation transporter [bacterium]